MIVTKFTLELLENISQIGSHSPGRGNLEKFSARQEYIFEVV